MKKLLLACFVVSFAAFASAQNIVFDFNAPAYSPGTIHGQQGWVAAGTATDRAQIVQDPDDVFGNQVLALQGSRHQPAGDGKMNHFATGPFGGTPSWFSADLWMAPEADPADPVELFIRFNGWDNFVVLRPTIDAIEIRRTPVESAPLLADVSIPMEEWFNFRMEYAVSGGFATSAEIFINDISVGTVGNLEDIEIGAGTVIGLRSRNTLTYIDNIAIPEPSTYASLFGALALAFVMFRRRAK